MDCELTDGGGDVDDDVAHWWLWLRAKDFSSFAVVTERQSFAGGVHPQRQKARASCKALLSAGKGAQLYDCLVCTCARLLSIDASNVVFDDFAAL